MLHYLAVASFLLWVRLLSAPSRSCCFGRAGRAGTHGR
jgi:hypothetical protein